MRHPSDINKTTPLEFMADGKNCETQFDQVPTKLSKPVHEDEGSLITHSFPVIRAARLTATNKTLETFQIMGVIPAYLLI